MDQNQWGQLTLPQQLANIASEVHRANLWHKKNELKHKQQAADRALELIDLTLSDPRWQHRLKEIARLREIFCDTLLEQQKYKITYQAINDYLLPFAILARK